MPLHPAAESLVKLLDDSGVGFYPDSTPESMRAAMETATGGMVPHDVHQVEDREIPGPAGSIPVRVYRPSAETPLPTLVWFHGWGWVIGALVTREHLAVPALQLLVYPVTDHEFDSPSMVDNAKGYFLETEEMRWFFDHYASAPDDFADWRMSPLRATELAGLPAAVVITA